MYFRAGLVVQWERGRNAHQCALHGQLVWPAKHVGVVGRVWLCNGKGVAMPISVRFMISWCGQPSTSVLQGGSGCVENPQGVVGLVPGGVGTWYREKKKP